MEHLPLTTLSLCLLQSRRVYHLMVSERARQHSSHHGTLQLPSTRSSTMGMVSSTKRCRTYMYSTAQHHMFRTCSYDKPPSPHQSWLNPEVEGTHSNPTPIQHQSNKKTNKSASWSDMSCSDMGQINTSKLNSPILIGEWGD